ncbi:MAG: hypothetical protein ACSHX9_02435 [Luteolibacter sp.]
MNLTQGKRYIILGLSILGVGAARLPFERGLSEELTEAKLMPPKLEVETSERIGQTFSAVTLGGLRTLVATILNLRAFTFFTEQKWADVEETFNVIVDLAPQTPYYWDTGAWHQSYNAASFYLYESDQPPLRRELNWRASVLRGEEFLKRGLRNMPENFQLHRALGMLYIDSNKINAFGEPEEAYGKAYEVFISAPGTGASGGMNRRFALYSIARIPGREKEALALAEEIVTTPGGRTATVLNLLYTLRYFVDQDQGVEELIDSIYPNRETAYELLARQWTRTSDRFPMHGIAKALSLLEMQLGVHPENSILKQEYRRPMRVDDMFPAGR